MLLVAFLSLLSFAGGAKAFDYEADGLTNGLLAVICIYAFVFFVLLGLSVPALAIAAGHRVPYVPLMIAVLSEFFSLLANIAYNVISSDADFDDDIPGDAFIATRGIASLFYNWSVALGFLAFAHLIKVRVDNVLRSSGSQKSGLSPVFMIGYFAAFVLIFIFATATAGTLITYLRAIFGADIVSIREINNRLDVHNNILYAFSAIWYASSVFLGVLAFFAYQTARRAGINDKVLKTLLFVAFPLHALHVLVDIIFLIIWSPSGLKVTRDNFEALRRASLAEAILYLGFHAAVFAVLIFLGLKRSNWMLGGEKNTAWQGGQYAGYPAYPMQGNTMVQQTYPAQTNYTTQAGYPTQNHYAISPNSKGD